jgi:hypothetical protein
MSRKDLMKNAGARAAAPGSRPPAPLKLRGLATVLALFCLSIPALAGPGEQQEGPLTQTDIDAYIYLAPRLLGDIMNYPDQAAKLLAEANLTRERAIYITAKIPLTQALARGLISPGQLTEIPASLRPTTEEVQLVNANLLTLMQAESVAIDSSGVKVPIKRREVSRP